MRLASILLGSIHVGMPVFIVRAATASVLPALLLAAASNTVLRWLGFSPEQIVTVTSEPSWSNLLGLLILAPVLETLMLAWPVALSLSAGVRASRIAGVSAAVWGLLHLATRGPGALLPAAWAFYILTTAFLMWRPQSFRHAFSASAAPHACHNAFAFLIGDWVS
jgi:hypothetical protein